MSTKDPNYSCECCICGDTLPGSDDGPMVWDALKHQQDTDPDCEGSCDLCGEEVSPADVRRIVEAGRPDTSPKSCT